MYLEVVLVVLVVAVVARMANGGLLQLRIPIRARNRVTGIDPVGVDVDGGREVGDVGVEALVADLAAQGADGLLLAQLHGHAALVVAEEAGELGGEGFSLPGHGLAGCLLALSLPVSMAPAVVTILA